VHDFTLPPRCRWDLCSSAMLRSVDWQFLTYVSGQHVGAIFKGQAVQVVVSDCLIFMLSEQNAEQPNLAFGRKDAGGACYKTWRRGAQCSHVICVLTVWLRRYRWYMWGRIEVPSPFGEETWERLLLRPRCEDNIKKDFKGILWEGVDWTNLASQMDI